MIKWKSICSLALVFGLGAASVASAQPPYRRGTWRGGGDISWDPRFDWGSLPSARPQRSTWRYWDEMSFNSWGSGVPGRRGTWRGGGDVSWDPRFDWNPGTTMPTAPWTVPDSRFEDSWESRWGN